MSNKKLVYIVIGRFTEAIVPVVHISAYSSKKEAHDRANEVSGIVVSRVLHRPSDKD